MLALAPPLEAAGEPRLAGRREVVAAGSHELHHAAARRGDEAHREGRMRLRWRVVRSSVGWPALGQLQDQPLSSSAQAACKGTGVPASSQVRGSKRWLAALVGEEALAKRGVAGCGARLAVGADRRAAVEHRLRPLRGLPPPPRRPASSGPGWPTSAARTSGCGWRSRPPGSARTATAGSRRALRRRVGERDVHGVRPLKLRRSRRARRNAHARGPARCARRRRRRASDRRSAPRGCAPAGAAGRLRWR